MSDSSAILAESLGAIGGIGGAGGVGGAVGAGGPAGSISSSTTNIASCLGSLFDSGSCTYTMSWNAGASGTAAGTDSNVSGETSYTGGHGGNVNVNNSGAVVTSGTYSDGITAISMGGVHGLNSYNANRVFWDGLPAGTQSGGAGDVMVDNQSSGNIQTAGANSAAIMGLSMGAGYGSGKVTATNAGTLGTSGENAHALVAASRVLDVNSLTGAAADNVTASNIGGTITATGAGSSGIIAESTSESGAAGNVTVDSTRGYVAISGQASASAILALSQASGEGNNSGNISVVNADGTILSATGGQASAVDVRSISAGGNSGAIMLDNRGGSITSDNTGTAVYLQSSAVDGSALNSLTAGDDDPYNIVLLNHSAIVSTALGSTAVTLQSTDDAGGNIYLENGGLIEGGAGGSAIALLGGNNNLIINDSTLDPEDRAILRTKGGVLDTVISGTTGNDAIRNLSGATIIGSVHLHDGDNSFYNGVNSYYLPGNTVYLGTGKLFTNEGYLSPGGLNNVMSISNANNITTITGNYTQTGTGHIVADLNFTTGAAATDYADYIEVTGAATLNGYLTLNPTTGAGKPGNFKIPVLGAGSISGDIEIYKNFANGSPSSTVVFKPGTLIEDNKLYVTYDVDYNPDFLTSNAHNYASCVNNTQTLGVPGYQPVADALLAIWEPVKYQQAVDSLTGEGTIASQQGIFSARANFSGSVMDNSSALLDCDKDAAGVNKQACDSRARNWMRIDRNLSSQNGNVNEASSATASNTVSAGYEQRVGDMGVVGIAGAYAQNDFSVSNRWTSGHSDGVSLGLYAMVGSDAGFYTKAMVSAGYFENRHSRYAIGRHVSGDYSTSAVGVGGEIGLKKWFGNISVNPFAAVEYDRLHQSSYSENNETWGNRYETERVDSMPVALGFRLEGAFVNDLGFAVRPRMKYSYIREMQTDRNINISALPSPDCHCNIDGVSAPEYSQQLELGLKAQLTDSLEINANASGRWANDARTLGGAFGLNYSF
jgi:outer membrane autotransporter protein